MFLRGGVVCFVVLFVGCNNKDVPNAGTETTGVETTAETPGSSEGSALEVREAKAPGRYVLMDASEGKGRDLTISRKDLSWVIRAETVKVTNKKRSIRIVARRDDTDQVLRTCRLGKSSGNAAEIIIGSDSHMHVVCSTAPSTTNPNSQLGAMDGIRFVYDSSEDRLVPGGEWSGPGVVDVDSLEFAEADGEL